MDDTSFLFLNPNPYTSSFFRVLSVRFGFGTCSSVVRFWNRYNHGIRWWYGGQQEGVVGDDDRARAAAAAAASTAYLIYAKNNQNSVRNSDNSQKA